MRAQLRVAINDLFAGAVLVVPFGGLRFLLLLLLTSLVLPELGLESMLDLFSVIDCILVYLDGFLDVSDLLLRLPEMVEHLRLVQVFLRRFDVCLREHQL